MDQGCLITNASEGSVRLVDLKTGTLLYSFKQNVHQPSNKGEGRNRQFGSSLVAVGSTPGSYTASTGLLPPINLIASLQADRPLLHLYGWGKEFPRLRFSLPEAMTSVALLPSLGTGLCVTGANTGRLYLWELPSGRLARVIEAHYKAIRTMSFSAEGDLLVTASDDASVHVWSLAELYHPKLNGIPKPTHAWTDHTLPVTHIKISQGQGQLRAFTASLDATCKVWDLVSGHLLATYLLPSPVTALAIDSREASLVAGCEDGIIYLLPLFDTVEPSRSKVGNGAVLSIEPTTSYEEQSRSTFRGHKGQITTLQFDITGTLLISGDKEGQTMVWDVSSRQPIRFLNAGILLNTAGAVTSLNIFSTPKEFLRPGMVNNTGFPELAIFSKFHQEQEKLPWIPPVAEDNADSVPFPSTCNSEVPYPGLLSLNPLSPPQFGHSSFNLTASSSVPVSDLKQVEKLEADILELYQVNSQLRDINQQLYTRLVHPTSPDEE